MAHKTLRKFKTTLTAPSIYPTVTIKTVEIEAIDEDDVRRWWKAVGDTKKYKYFTLKTIEPI